MFVSRQELEATKAKLAKINARAAKRGFTGRFEIVATPKTVTYNNNGFEVTKHGFDVEITGDAPSYGGWTFLAKVENLGESAVISAAPGSDVKVKNEDFAAGGCEHCNVNRYRKHTFIVRNDETNELKQVGSTCLKDFLGWDGNFVFIDEETVANQAFGTSGSAYFDYDVREIAALAFAATAAFGYVSTQDWGSVATRDVVTSILTGAKGSADTLNALQPHMLPSEIVESRIEMVMESFTEDYGYQANMKAIFEASAVEWKHIGLAASIAAAFQRLVEGEAKRKAKAEGKVSNWVGEEFEKITFEGVVTMVRSIENNYGYRTSYSNLIAVTTEEGNVIKMFTAAAWSADVEEGDTVKIMAQIKDHETYNGRKETLVNRPKLIK